LYIAGLNGYQTKSTAPTQEIVSKEKKSGHEVGITI